MSWGLATALSKYVLEQLRPLDLLGVEVLTGAIAMGTLTAVRSARRVSRWWLLIGAMEPGLAFALFDLGLDRTSASHGALLLATETLFTIVLAVALLGEHVGRPVFVALLLGIAGSVLVVWQQSDGDASIRGDALVLLASFAAGAGVVASRRIAGAGDALAATTLQLLGALAVAAPAFLIGALNGGTELTRADPTHIAAAVCVGLASTVVPLLLFNTAIGKVDASRAGLVLTLIPVFAVITSVSALGDTLTELQLLGGTLVVAGAALASRSEAPPPEGSDR